MSYKFISYAENRNHLEPVLVVPVAHCKTEEFGELWTAFHDYPRHLHALGKIAYAETVLIGYPMGPQFQLSSMSGKARWFQLALLYMHEGKVVADLIYGGSVLYDESIDAANFLNENFGIQWQSDNLDIGNIKNTSETRSRLDRMRQFLQELTFVQQASKEQA